MSQTKNYDLVIIFWPTLLGKSLDSCSCMLASCTNSMGVAAVLHQQQLLKSSLAEQLYRPVFFDWGALFLHPNTACPRKKLRRNQKWTIDNKLQFIFHIARAQYNVRELNSVGDRIFGNFLDLFFKGSLCIN